MPSHEGAPPGFGKDLAGLTDWVSYFRNALGAVLVYDITEKQSFEALDQWLTKVREWSPEATLCLVGNKSDQGGKRKVTSDQGQQYAKVNEIPVFFETSAQSGNHVKEAFASLMASECPGAGSGDVLMEGSVVYEKHKAQGGDEYRFDQSRIVITDFDGDEEEVGCC